MGIDENELTDKIIGAAIEVHRHLGPGLLESAYEECLCCELSQSGLRFKRQVHLPIHYKGIRPESAYRVDLVVEDAVVVEIEATEQTPAIYSAQVLTYLKAAGLRVGLLMNFNVPVLTRGLKRIVNRYDGPAPNQLDAETRRHGGKPMLAPSPGPRAHSESQDSNHVGSEPNYPGAETRKRGGLTLASEPRGPEREPREDRGYRGSNGSTLGFPPRLCVSASRVPAVIPAVK